VPEAQATVSVFDHGLLYGDGVFEGIRSYGSRVFLLRDHVARLYDSAKAIDLHIPMSQEEMVNAVVETCRANDVRDGYIRLVVTRGVGSLGLSPYRCKTPQVIIIAGAIQLYPPECYEKGLKIVTVGTVRNAPEAINPRIKSLNYLNNILAKIEAINSGVEEALMLNQHGYVAEATGDNVFFVKGNTLATPHPTAGCLEGITRNAVMSIAVDMGMRVVEPTVSRYDLYTADEVFLTGSAAELIPVVEIDRRQIGNGTPGPQTLTLLARFKAFTRDPANGELIP
jgi:branched-chain amino acid aminotransferase